MRQLIARKLYIVLLVLLIPVSVYAVELEEAAKQAAKNNNAKVLSAKTVKQGDNRTHEIKLLTNKGVVKTVRVPDNSKKKKKKD
jgi:cell division protein YceG involved in septum cleavage